MNKKILKNKKGFTLIELIVVIAIIAILAAIAIPTFNGVIQSSKEANAISVARNVNTLARVAILNTEIDGKDITTMNADDATSTDVKYTKVFEEAGAIGTDDTITVANGVVTAISITEDGVTCTYSSTGDDAGKYIISRPQS